MGDAILVQQMSSSENSIDLQAGIANVGGMSAITATFSSSDFDLVNVIVCENNVYAYTRWIEPNQTFEPVPMYSIYNKGADATESGTRLVVTSTTATFRRSGTAYMVLFWQTVKF